ncbi:MAG TPA: helix-turn-helix transcriptional regulator [Terriglobia bacterium]|nr:helix-turn-helix transcriptional regulator [Terriglobia bacterium]
MPNRFEGYISNFMRQRRLELDLTQREVAEVVGVTPDFIALLEAGMRRLDLARMPRLADALSTARGDLCAWALLDRCPELFAEIFSVESVAAPPETGTVHRGSR